MGLRRHTQMIKAAFTHEDNDPLQTTHHQPEV